MNLLANWHGFREDETKAELDARALHERLAVEIPEADYARLVTLDDVVGYLARKLGAAP